LRQDATPAARQKWQEAADQLGDGGGKEQSESASKSSPVHHQVRLTSEKPGGFTDFVCLASFGVVPQQDTEPSG
jgi:hypothetical protein